MQDDGSVFFDIRLSPLSLQHTFLSVKARMQEMLRLIEATEGEDFGPMPNAMLNRYQFRIYSRSVKNVVVDNMDRIGKYFTHDAKLELIEIPPQQSLPSDSSPSLALYTHPNGQKEWLPCTILFSSGFMEDINGVVDETIKIFFHHEQDPEARERHAHIYNRGDVLPSLSYMKGNAEYNEKEIPMILS